MSEQNRYHITFNYKSSETKEWAGWTKGVLWEVADTWQDSIKNILLGQFWVVGEYMVVA